MNDDSEIKPGALQRIANGIPSFANQILAPNLIQQVSHRFGFELTPEILETITFFTRPLAAKLKVGDWVAEGYKFSHQTLISLNLANRLKDIAQSEDVRGLRCLLRCFPRTVSTNQLFDRAFGKLEQDELDFLIEILIRILAGALYEETSWDLAGRAAAILTRCGPSLKDHGKIKALCRFFEHFVPKIPAKFSLAFEPIAFIGASFGEVGCFNAHFSRSRVEGDYSDLHANVQFGYFGSNPIKGARNLQRHFECRAPELWLHDYAFFRFIYPKLGTAGEKGNDLRCRLLDQFLDGAKEFGGPNLRGEIQDEFRLRLG